MGKYCPVLKRTVLYVDCNECDDKKCMKYKDKKDEKQNEKQLDKG